MGEEIEAVDDFASTYPGEPVSINILDNDIGDGLRVTQIVESPQCGEIFEWSEFGQVVYVADADTECTVDVFRYEVEDNLGEKDTATVSIIIDQSSRLNVQIERDCSGAYETGNYSLEVYVGGDAPPFAIDMNGQKDTLYEQGIIAYEVLESGDTEYYEIVVTDSTMQEYTWKAALSPCTWVLCEEKLHVNYTTTCIGDEKVSIEIISQYEDAYYIDSDGQKHLVEPIDTIPNFCYLNISIGNYFILDTLINCLSANNDSFEVAKGKVYSLNILENDFGQGIQVSQILEMPQCGELLEWLPNGEITYQLNENEDCEQDKIVYELENAIGEKTTAMVEFNSIPEKKMYLTWDVSCESSTESCDITVEIHCGLSPFTVSGDLNEVTQFPSFSLLVPCLLSF